MQRLIDENMVAIANTVGPGHSHDDIIALSGVRQAYLCIMDTMFGEKSS